MNALTETTDRTGSRPVIVEGLYDGRGTTKELQTETRAEAERGVHWRQEKRSTNWSSMMRNQCWHKTRTLVIAHLNFDIKSFIYNKTKKKKNLVKVFVWGSTDYLTSTSNGFKIKGFLKENDLIKIGTKNTGNTLKSSVRHWWWGEQHPLVVGSTAGMYCGCDKEWSNFSSPCWGELGRCKQSFDWSLWSHVMTVNWVNLLFVFTKYDLKENTTVLL